MGELLDDDEALTSEFCTCADKEPQSLSTCPFEVREWIGLFFGEERAHLVNFTKSF